MLHVAMASPSGHLSLFVVGNPASHRASRIRMGCEVMSHSRLIHSILSRQVRVAVRKTVHYLLRVPIYPVSLTHFFVQVAYIAFTLPAAARCKRLVQSHFGASRALTSCESHLTSDQGHTVVTTLQKACSCFAAQRQQEPGRNLCCGHAKTPVKRSSFCAGPWKFRPHGRGSHVSEGSGSILPTLVACAHTSLGTVILVLGPWIEQPLTNDLQVPWALLRFSASLGLRAGVSDLSAGCRSLSPEPVP